MEPEEEIEDFKKAMEIVRSYVNKYGLLNKYTITDEHEKKMFGLVLNGVNHCARDMNSRDIINSRRMMAYLRYERALEEEEAARKADEEKAHG